MVVRAMSILQAQFGPKNASLAHYNHFWIFAEPRTDCINTPNGTRATFRSAPGAEALRSEPRPIMGKFQIRPQPATSIPFVGDQSAPERRLVREIIAEPDHMSRLPNLLPPIDLL